MPIPLVEGDNERRRKIHAMHAVAMDLICHLNGSLSIGVEGIRN
jgi:hypothetical protein